MTVNLPAKAFFGVLIYVGLAFCLFAQVIEAPSSQPSPAASQGSVASPGGDAAQAGSWLPDPQAAYRKALDMKAAGTDGFDQTFAQSAAGFESRVQDKAFGAGAWYDAATAWYWAGHPDKAILDYRRFLNENYFSPEAWDNLRQARIKAGTVEPGGEGAGSWPWSLWLLSAGLFVLNLAALLWGLFQVFRKKGLKTAWMAAAACALILGGAALASSWHRPSLGIITQDVLGRKGDSELYQAQPASPWKAGQEAWILQEKDTWVRVRVGEQTSWVPRQVLVRP